MSYTQLNNNQWLNLTDSSGPYIKGPGGAFILAPCQGNTITVASSVAPGYAQAGDGYWYNLSDASGPYVRSGALTFVLAGGVSSVNGASSVGGAKRLASIAVVGDSYVQQNSNGVTGVSGALTMGHACLLNILSGAPWRMDPQLDQFGVAGGQMANAEAQLAAIIARRPDILFIQCGGHNDFINNGASSAYVAALYARFKSFVGSVKAAGILPIIVLEYPSAQTGNTGLTAAQLKQVIEQFNMMKRSYANSIDAFVWDWWTAMVDPTSATGSVYSDSSDDGIHANTVGNMRIALQGQKDLALLIGPKTGALTVAQTDLYDATYNPLGNLETNAFFLSSYVASGVFTGTAPANWGQGSMVTGTGKTITTSLVASSDGIGQWYQTVISGTSTGSSNSQAIWIANASALTSSLSAGTLVEGWAEVSIAANSPFYAVICKLVAGSNVSYGGNPIAPGLINNNGPSNAWTGVVYIPPVQIPASGFSTMAMFLQLQYADSGGNFAGTASFRRPTARIVSSP